jgi:hypothetical protein
MGLNFPAGAEAGATDGTTYHTRIDLLEKSAFAKVGSCFSMPDVLVSLRRYDAILGYCRAHSTTAFHTPPDGFLSCVFSWQLNPHAMKLPLL